MELNPIIPSKQIREDKNSPTNKFIDGLPCGCEIGFIPSLLRYVIKSGQKGKVKAGFSQRNCGDCATGGGCTMQDLAATLGVKKPVVPNYIHLAYKRAEVHTRPRWWSGRRIAGSAGPNG